MYKPKPLKLGHLVLRVVDIDRSVAFYRDVVGLTVSDWIDDRMVFMRCAEDHHVVGLLKVPDGHTPATGANNPVEHFSFQVADIEEMKSITEMLQQRGIEIDRGLGRHGPGENTFIVFKDPDGNNVEFYSDMLQITEDSPYEAKVWDGAKLGTFDQWALKEFVVAPPERIKTLLDG